MPRLCSRTSSLSSGASAAAPKPRRTRPPRADAGLASRARRLAGSEIAFVGHPRFSRRDAADWLAEQAPPGNVLGRTEPVGDGGVAFVAGLVSAPLLTPAEERYCFLKMNYLRYRAEIARRRIDPLRPDRRLIAQVEADLAESVQYRNHIVRSNLRLIVAIARKLSRSMDQLTELISEGFLPLVRAVELFDVHRGYRFSTYATWAIRNQLQRTLQREQQRSERYVPFADNESGVAREANVAPADAEPRQQRRGPLLERLLATLPERDREIMLARFGLEGRPAGQSLSEVSAQFGLSKERVRQIVLRSLESLRTSAEATELADQF